MLSWGTVTSTTGAGTNTSTNTNTSGSGTRKDSTGHHRNSITGSLFPGVSASTFGLGGSNSSDNDKNSSSRTLMLPAHQQSKDLVRVKVATSKRSVVVVVPADASVADFLDVVSGKIIRGFPPGSVVFNPQPVVAVMTRDGYFFDDDDLVRYAFEQDTELLALTHEELRAALKHQIDPFFSRPVVSDRRNPVAAVMSTPHHHANGNANNNGPLSVVTSLEAYGFVNGNGGVGVGDDEFDGAEGTMGQFKNGASGSRSSGQFDDGNNDNGRMSSRSMRSNSLSASASASTSGYGGYGASGSVGSSDDDDYLERVVAEQGLSRFSWNHLNIVGANGVSGKDQPLVFLSFAKENSSRMAEGGNGVGVCDPYWIYSSLKEAGFNVFIDASDREAGEPLSEELVEMMLKATHFVTCISKEYAQSLLCENEFKFSRFKKRIICLVGGNNLEFFKTTAVGYMCGQGDVHYLDFTKQESMPKSLDHLKNFLAKDELNPSETLKVSVPPLVPRRGRIYISYCWENSSSAMRAAGQLAGPGVGLCDPRAVARRLKSAGFECWMDVHKSLVGSTFPSHLSASITSGNGTINSAATTLNTPTQMDPGTPRTPTALTSSKHLRNGMDLPAREVAMIDPDDLADALTQGMDNSDCMLAFISDEFVEAPQLAREFHFAHNVLRVPLIPVIVGAGTGSLWRGGPVGDAVGKYIHLDASGGDVVGELFARLLKILFKIVCASAPPEGPRREWDGEEEEDEKPLPVPGEDEEDGERVEVLEELEEEDEDEEDSTEIVEESGGEKDVVVVAEKFEGAGDVVVKDGKGEVEVEEVKIETKQEVKVVEDIAESTSDEEGAVLSESTAV
ncbi:hypothetical protein HDU76_003167 [Blyttiomyces sp. JEL0837]|nr:hypothetical protein HDU76_003167 [Blyttiomyces sp. JEL0837]